MKPTKELFERMLPGDFVIVKTLGQMIDSGWVFDTNWGLLTHYRDWAAVSPELMCEQIGQMCRIKKICINPLTDEMYFILEEDEFELPFTYEMMKELYPLVRGYYK